ncbi:DUF1259 domain-containing protein [Massilibacterium senegalense]|uniref:DUF1259 domain-containing protein n=1 Tax=Massilibacterium senegalense TaxID=1632858 RepID=UPI002D77BAFB|nr:DUF1259 domain-containing protein [Massilibacterium senegalense]
MLKKEFNTFISALRKRSIIVNVLHNHWLLDEPMLMYILFDFVKNSFEATKDADLF